MTNHHIETFQKGFLPYVLNPIQDGLFLELLMDEGGAGWAF